MKRRWIVAALAASVPLPASAQEAQESFAWSWDNVVRVVQENGTNVAMNVLGAVALWIVGRVLIGWAIRLAEASFARAKVDATLSRYLGSTLRILLNVALIVAVLGFFGVETTSFAALLAGAGLAIGTAWGGLLSNFAAGVFLVVLKPYKVGDFVTAGGVTGTVREVGLFTTNIDTPDGVHTIVGNGKVFGDNIQNFSANSHRRVDLVAQLAHDADHARAIELLKAAVSRIEHVATSPAPDVEILEFNVHGPVLAVRPYTHTDHYWQVYFDGNRAIRDTLGAAGYPVPWQKHQVHEVKAAS